MPTDRFRAYVGFFAVTVLCSGAAAQAQLVPWRVFADAESPSVCDLVNASNAELVVLLNDDIFTIVSGADSDLINTEITNDGQVFIDGEPFGFVEFATDADGFRTLWWVALNGRVIELDPVTLSPQVSDLFPSDFANVPCDACPFWDDGSICTCISDSECDDLDECTLDECDPLGGCTHIEIICETDEQCLDAVCDPVEGCILVEREGQCNDGDACTEDDACEGGECLGFLVECDDGISCTRDLCDPDLGCVFDDDDCDDNGGGGGGGPVFIICGPQAGLSMMLMFSGLVAIRAVSGRVSRRHV